MAWVGLSLVSRPRRAWAAGSDRAVTGAAASPRRGLLTNLLNPKVGVFYVSLLPQFVPAGFPVVPSILGLAALHVLMGCAWLALLAAGLGGLRPALARPSVVAALDRRTGAVFLGFGLRLALDRR